MGDIAKFKQGIQVDLERQYTEKAVGRERFIRIVDYTQSTDDIRYIDKTDNANYVDEKDIVVVRYGATAGFVGRGITGIIANNMFTINPLEELDKEFLYTYMKQEKMYNYLNLSNGSSAMPAINFGIMKSLDISYTSTEEQQQIGAYFSNLDHLITLHQRNYLNSMRFSLLYLPIVWEQRKLGDTNTYFTDGNYGEAYPKPSDMTDSSEGVPFLTGGNLKCGRLDITDASYITKEKHEKLTSGHLVEDDIVIAVRGSLGALGYVNKGNSGWNINSQLAILRTDKTVLSGKYLLQFLLSGNGQIELIKRQTGSALKQLPINAIRCRQIIISGKNFTLCTYGAYCTFYTGIDN